MKVLVVHDYVRRDATDLRIVRFVMIATVGGGMNMVSPIMTLERAAPNYDDNPYRVYGDVCAKFTGLDKFALTIIVAECRSGNLESFGKGCDDHA
jgi:hypothetical protein